jgi:hypothetical protein
MNKRKFKAPLRDAPFFESALRKNVTSLSTSANLNSVNPDPSSGKDRIAQVRFTPTKGGL